VVCISTVFMASLALSKVNVVGWYMVSGKTIFDEAERCRDN